MPRAVPAGILPRAALRYLRQKRRRPSQHWTDVWREEHAVAFTVAQMTQDAMLGEVHQALAVALRKGETLETFRARLEPWLEQRGWAPRGRGGDVPTRLKRIYNTNLRTARAAGQWDRISKNADLLPYLVYELGPSEEHREEHAAWAGLCLKADDPWWNTHYPPNGWGCKCRVRQVAEPPKDSTTTAPEVETREWTNPATGEVRQVAKGIDPGWDYHVGAQRTQGVNLGWLRRVERAAEGRGPAAASRMVERHVEGPGFRWFVRRPRTAEVPRREARPGLVEATPVAVLPDAAVADLGASSAVVRLTEPVMHAQAVSRAGVPARLYARLQEVLEAKPQRQAGGAPRWTFTRTLDVGGERRRVRAVLEARPGGPVELVSLRLGKAPRPSVAKARKALVSEGESLYRAEQAAWAEWRAAGKRENYNTLADRLEARRRDAVKQAHDRLFGDRGEGDLVFGAVPPDMRDKAEQAGRFVRRLIGEGEGIGTVNLRIDRAGTERMRAVGYARIRRGDVALAPDAGPKTIVHEIMHIAEGRSERRLTAAVEWYDKHTAGDPLESDKAYAWGLGRRDKLEGWDAHYAGSQPFSVESLGDDASAGVMSARDGLVGGTEVTTRAADMLFDDPFSLATQNPHLFDFIYDTYISRR